MEEVKVDLGGGCQKLTLVANTSQQSARLTKDHAYVFCTADTFVRFGVNPVALGTGVDQFIPANTRVRLSGWGNSMNGDGTGADIVLKLAFISAATPTVYIS